jgi:hypothetical protein
MKDQKKVLEKLLDDGCVLDILRDLEDLCREHQRANEDSGETERDMVEYWRLSKLAIGACMQELR